MNHSTEEVVYVSLEFLGFPEYRVGDDGSVWSRKNNKWNRENDLNEYKVGKIKELRAMDEKTWTYRKLAETFVVSPGTISNVVHGRTHGHGEWKQMKLFPSKDSGHLSVALSCGKDKPQVWFRVHRLVLEAFVGPCPERMEACHFPDRNPANNRLGNLRWDTHEGNEQDKKTHGTYQFGENNPIAKLTWEKVDEMRRLREEECWELKPLADKFGCKIMNASCVCSYKTWKPENRPKQLNQSSAD